MQDELGQLINTWTPNTEGDNPFRSIKRNWHKHRLASSPKVSVTYNTIERNILRKLDQLPVWSGSYQQVKMILTLG